MMYSWKYFNTTCVMIFLNYRQLANCVINMSAILIHHCFIISPWTEDSTFSSYLTFCRTQMSLRTVRKSHTLAEFYDCCWKINTVIYGFNSIYPTLLKMLHLQICHSSSTPAFRDPPRIDRPLHVAYLDIKAAFDSVDRQQEPLGLQQQREYHRAAFLLLLCFIWPSTGL